MTLTEALNQCASENGIALPWDKAVEQLKRQAVSASILEEQIYLDSHFKPSNDYFEMEKNEEKINFTYSLVCAIVEVVGEDAKVSKVMEIARSFEKITELESVSSNSFISSVVRNGKAHYEMNFDDSNQVAK